MHEKEQKYRSTALTTSNFPRIEREEKREQCPRIERKTNSYASNIHERNIDVRRSS